MKKNYNTGAINITKNIVAIKIFRNALNIETNRKKYNRYNSQRLLIINQRFPNFFGSHIPKTKKI